MIAPPPACISRASEYHNPSLFHSHGTSVNVLAYSSTRESLSKSSTPHSAPSISTSSVESYDAVDEIARILKAKNGQRRRRNEETQARVRLSAAEAEMAKRASYLCALQKQQHLLSYGVKPQQLHAPARVKTINRKLDIKPKCSAKKCCNTIDDLIVLERAQRMASGDRVLIRIASAENELKVAEEQCNDAQENADYLRSLLPQVTDQIDNHFPDYLEFEDQYVDWGHN